MKAIRKFLTATILAGLLFVVPILVLILVVVHAVQAISSVLRPVAEMLPYERTTAMILADLLAVVLLLALCFVAGIVVATRPGRALGSRAERMVLGRLPGFMFIKSITSGLAGLDSDSELAVVLARFDDYRQLAFVVERNPGGLVTVFVPGAPTAMSGNIYFMTEDRLTPLNVPVMKALGCISRLGVGSRALFELAGHPQFVPNADSGRDKPVE